MYNEYFLNVFRGFRKSKPRDVGITVIIDHGLGVETEKDILEVSSEYIDIAKIMVGIPALIEKSVLAKKIELYHEKDVLAFPGGQFLEYAFRFDRVHQYFEAVKNAGFRLIEVSDNLLDISPAEKSKLIKIAREEYGFKVLGETGNKKVLSDSQKLIDDILNCLESGAWKVMFEAAELFDRGQFRSDLIGRILNRISLDNLIFELPGGWISGITVSHIYSLQVWLIEELGAEVNIGNVNPFDVLCLEAERNNLGTHMKL
mgnify:FL=1